MPARSKAMIAALVGLAIVAAAGLAWRFSGPRHQYLVEGQAESHGEWVDGALATASADAVRNATYVEGGSSPHAIHDPLKRQEILRLLLQAQQQAAPDPTVTTPTNARGNRETNDVEEFGRFVTEAITNDFMPMAKTCARDLAARQPDAGAGTVRVDFKLLGDKKIGGVVDTAKIDEKHSTLHDEKFAECMRESMYGVYFDPPPAGGEATLNFDVDIQADGGVADEVEDFHPIDRRNEPVPSAQPVR